MRYYKSNPTKYKKNSSACPNEILSQVVKAHSMFKKLVNIIIYINRLKKKI